MTPPRTTPRRNPLLRSSAVLAALLSPVVLAGLGAGSGTASTAATYEPRPPFVSRPLDPAAVRSVESGRTTKPKTVFSVPCGTGVRAAHPGSARVVDTVWGGPNTVQVVTSGGVKTLYGHMRRRSVETGYLIQSGQQVGEVGRQGTATKCTMQMRVFVGGKRIDPASWLDRSVGKPVEVTGLYGDDGFMLGSFNVLGASHTGKDGNKAAWPDYQVRMPKAVNHLNRYGAEVVGLQEFQKKQKLLFQELTGKQWGIWPKGVTNTDTENSLIWRRSAFRKLDGGTVPIPYFKGHIRQMPWLLLQDRVTGRTAYVLNVHNPATTKAYPGSAPHRAEAIRREREWVIQMRATGRPVFLTGDFNDREKAFCPLTEGKLMISPDSIPSMECAMPRYFWVDWIFAAGQARFTTLTVDTSMKPKQISDHPIVIARTHLAD